MKNSQLKKNLDSVSWIFSLISDITLEELQLTNMRPIKLEYLT